MWKDEEVECVDCGRLTSIRNGKVVEDFESGNFAIQCPRCALKTTNYKVSKNYFRGMKDNEGNEILNDLCGVKEGWADRFDRCQNEGIDCKKCSVNPWYIKVYKK